MAPPTLYKDVLVDLSTDSKKPTARPARVDLDKSCGVDTNGSPCPKPLRDCQTHSRAQKRAVLGRSCSYDMLIIPSWNQNSHAPAPAADNGEGLGKGVKSAKFGNIEDPGKFVAKSEKKFDNGEGSSKGATKTEKKAAKKTNGEEKIPKKEAETSSTTRNGKRKAEDEDSDEDGPKTPMLPKGKKRGPKAWTVLEAESKWLHCHAGTVARRHD